VQAGLTPYQALATATRNVAAFLGTLDSAGTVAVGQRADLVLVTGNPLEQLSAIASQAGVMVGGRWLARAEIDARVAEIVEQKPNFKELQAIRERWWRP
jgi:imidazolonepropionase-like amidohydrolase